MPSNKHNSRMATARDLISSLINVASSRDVPFHQPQLLQCLHHTLPLYPFDLPYFSSQPCKVTICGRHVMASVRDIKIAEALLVLCLTYYVMKWVRHCWNWGVMVFTYRDMGHAFSQVYSLVSRGQTFFSCGPHTLCAQGVWSAGKKNKVWPRETVYSPYFP